MFKSVLIANRGEIACRIMRTARSLGMRTIAVHSSADTGARHVRMADEAHLLGGAAAAESYLAHDKVLEIARQTGAECIHPGYGFLSENVEFAEKCGEAEITFVGPPPYAIRAMGLKDAAKALMIKAGVPVTPGYQGDNQSPEFLRDKARETGYPVMIKAVAGGGGKGMRRVDRHVDFDEALKSCMREAKSAFGDDRVLIEKFISTPRHIECQIFADTHGNCIHLFERDCSLQRRHQKVIEEAPAPGMTQDMRRHMGTAAVNAAKAVGYAGAGTVEFIVDGSGDMSADGFYFMEMNTRLQVEHPVTEAITGVDLVDWQFRVAAGEELPLKQDQLGIDGHAVEARVYAEDPANGFLPQSGKLHQLGWPDENAELRIDAGVDQGDVVSPHYDPMIAKVIAHGPDRQTALDRLSGALRDVQILGLRTNIGFLDNLLNLEDFRSGAFDTGLIDRKIGTLAGGGPGPEELAIAAHCWITLNRRKTDDPWSALGGWSLSGTSRTGRIDLVINGEPVSLLIEWNTGDGTVYRLAEGSETGDPVTIPGMDETCGDGLIVFANGERFPVRKGQYESGLYLLIGGRHLHVAPADVLNREEGDASAATTIRAPMSGKVIAVDCKPGQSVRKGDRLGVLEAMKMEHPLVAGTDTVVESVEVGEGDQVAEGQILITLTSDDG